MEKLAHTFCNCLSLWSLVHQTLAGCPAAGLATESDQEQHLWIGGADGVLRVHDVHSGHLLKAWKAHNAGVAGLSLCRVERATANHSGDYSAFYNADNATMDSVVSK